MASGPFISQAANGPSPILPAQASSAPVAQARAGVLARPRACRSNADTSVSVYDESARVSSSDTYAFSSSISGLGCHV